jgi:hypothetical protein
MTTEMTRRGLFARAGALALAGPMALAAGTTIAQATDEEVDAFFNKGFNDIKYLRQAIRKAAKRFDCTTGFNYKDSDSVAEFWKHA